MPGPMEGIRVVEVGMWVAGPIGGGGARRLGRRRRQDRAPRRRSVPRPARLRSVATGRTRRSSSTTATSAASGSTSRTEEGRRIAGQLVDDADVFVTNARVSRARTGRARLRDAVGPQPSARVRAASPGYGVEGDERGRAAYDVGAFWSRAGVAAALTPEGADLPYQRGGMGDHMAGMAAAGAVAAALFARERTGRGPARVDVAAPHRDVHDGLGHQHVAAPGHPGRPDDREGAAQPAHHRLRRRRRPPVLDARSAGRSPLAGRAAGRRPARAGPTTLASAPIEARWQHSAELVEELSMLFATQPLGEWAEIFDREDVWWAPVQDAHETIDDPQAAAAGGFVEVPTADGGEPVRMVATPGRLRGHALGRPIDVPGVRAAHRGGPARARLRLGPHHRTEGRRRHPLTASSPSQSVGATRLELVTSAV